MWDVVGLWTSDPWYLSRILPHFSLHVSVDGLRPQGDPQRISSKDNLMLSLNLSSYKPQTQSETSITIISITATLTKSSHHLQNISRRKGLLSQRDLEKLASLFSRLDYCNVVLTGLSNAIDREAAANSHGCRSSPHRHRESGSYLSGSEKSTLAPCPSRNWLQNPAVGL